MCRCGNSRLGMLIISLVQVFYENVQRGWSCPNIWTPKNRDFATTTDQKYFRSHLLQFVQNQRVECPLFDAEVPDLGLPGVFWNKDLTYPVGVSPRKKQSWKGNQKCKAHIRKSLLLDRQPKQEDECRNSKLENSKKGSGVRVGGEK